MKVLAVDLGDTIGYAFVIQNGAVEHGLALHGTHELGTAFPDYHLCLEADLVVVERPAYAGPPTVQQRYSDAIDYYRHLFGSAFVKVIRPTDWMPRFHSYPLPGRGVLKTQHEKDAFRMAHWALEKFGGQK